MKRTHFDLLFVLLVLCMLSGGSGKCMAASKDKVVPILEELIPALRSSKTPVYLPTWIPSWPYKMYPYAFIGDYEYPGGYMVVISAEKDDTSSASTLFYLSAGQGTPKIEKDSAKVKLKNGAIAYYKHRRSRRVVDLAIGKYAYHISASKPQAELLKVAESMVLVK